MIDAFKIRDSVLYGRCMIRMLRLPPWRIRFDVVSRKGGSRFNVGGKSFETTASTLANAGRHSMLGALLEPPAAG